MISNARFLPFVRVGLLTFVPQIALPVIFFVTWRSPRLLGETAALECMATVVLEFLIIHSTGFFGAAAQKSPDGKPPWKHIAGLGLFYSIFALPTCILVGATWPMVTFWARAAGTLWTVFGGTGAERELQSRRLGVSALAYLGTAPLMIFLPLPAWGFDSDTVSWIKETMDERGFETGGDIASTEPHRIVAWGFMYYTIVALWEGYARVKSGRTR